MPLLSSGNRRRCVFSGPIAAGLAQAWVAVEGLRGRALRRLPPFAEGDYTALVSVNVPRAGRGATPKCCRGLEIGAGRGVRRRGVITQSQGIIRAV